MNKNKGKKFKIIPVIDILNGVAVHAKKGVRNQYIPVKSSIIQSTSPEELSIAFQEKLLSEEIYIADLDSIIKRQPNLRLIEKISKIPKINILVDLGIRNHTDIIDIMNYNIKIILGTETIENLNEVDKILDIMDKERLVVSIDIKENKIMSNNEEIKSLDIFSLIDIFVQKGIRTIILLNLSKVGTKSGGFDDKYSIIRKKYPDLEILIGGGVKDLHDIIHLKKEKMNGVLIATILHEGLVDLDIIKNLNK